MPAAILNPRCTARPMAKAEIMGRFLIRAPMNLVDMMLTWDCGERKRLILTQTLPTVQEERATKIESKLRFHQSWPMDVAL